MGCITVDGRVVIDRKEPDEMIDLIQRDFDLQPHEIAALRKEKIVFIEPIDEFMQSFEGYSPIRIR